MTYLFTSFPPFLQCLEFGGYPPALVTFYNEMCYINIRFNDLFIYFLPFCYPTSLLALSFHTPPGQNASLSCHLQNLDNCGNILSQIKNSEKKCKACGLFSGGSLPHLQFEEKFAHKSGKWTATG